jgi:hypothetical protein
MSLKSKAFGIACASALAISGAIALAGPASASASIGLTTYNCGLPATLSIATQRWSTVTPYTTWHTWQIGTAKFTVDSGPTITATYLTSYGGVTVANFEAFTDGSAPFTVKSATCFH